MKYINGEDKEFFGTRKSDGARIVITKPKWDCGWYWSFGYLGNMREHSHLSKVISYFRKERNKEEPFYLSDIQGDRNINMYDALKAEYDLNPKIEKNLWLFCELATTAYVLKQTAEVLGRGGSNYYLNPLAETIKNSDEVRRINEEVLPGIFNKIAEIFEGVTK